ncbi:hypothetical protein [Phenylobacterium sp.]|uniref:hypothetical protein n=1 Tax=Phenylobacterium sp. TaxID=1871053 RepID=UPI00273151F9|nr:hypothetical protein [Phenylobacterium sp.]MDP1617065.1 hypothetical protein [Phenylobacterium sp.]MDP1988527.1 hypothetical protein [Phenylobacterium sp.]
MNFAAIVLSAAALATAGSAAAVELKDNEFLEATRCRALAKAETAGLDTAAIDNMLRDQAYGRTSRVLEQAKSERSRANRQARSSDEKLRFEIRQEVSGPCQVWLGGEQSVEAARAAAPSAD